MCCFTVAAPIGWLARLRPPLRVSRTNIFARMVSPGVQAIAYSMKLATSRDVAMVLPLPVRPNAGESAVRFVDLHAHPNMFDELAALFVVEQPVSRQAPLAKTLTVHTVGSFVASYVPTRADFARLDPRFRLPDVLFDAVPRYADYGFAVFQLRPGNLTIHPMAFTFPARELERIFFPTVHLHDGRFHRTADFDHALYYQHPRVRAVGQTIDHDEASQQLPAHDYAGLVDRARPIVRRELRGELVNADTWIRTERPPTVRPT